MHKIYFLTLCIAALIYPMNSNAQSKKTNKKTKNQVEKATPANKKEDPIKPFDKVITKEAVTDAARMAALLPLRSSGFVVLSGDDSSACEAMLAGADGVVSVASNVVPVAFRRLCDLARSGAEAARSLAADLAPLHLALMLEPNPIPLKALLAALGLYQNCLRLPLLPLSSRFESELEALAQPALAVEARLRLEHAA